MGVDRISYVNSVLGIILIQHTNLQHSDNCIYKNPLSSSRLEFIYSKKLKPTNEPEADLPEQNNHFENVETNIAETFKITSHSINGIKHNVRELILQNIYGKTLLGIKTSSNPMDMCLIITNLNIIFL